MKKMIGVAVCLAALSGCATVMNDSTHPVRVETKTQDGRLVSGADCSVTNDKSSIRGRSGETLQVRRSSKDLDITCTLEGMPPATARAISRTNAGMWGNIILGGAVGAIVDHNKGTAYTYPTWIQLIFGRTLTFDRRDEESGAPVAAKEVGRADDAALAAAEITAPVPPSKSADVRPAATLQQESREKDPAKRCDACKNLSIP